MTKYPNRSVNPQGFVKTAINSGIFLYDTVYRALKLPYRPSLVSITVLLVKIAISSIMQRCKLFIHLL